MCWLHNGGMLGRTRRALGGGLVQLPRLAVSRGLADASTAPASAEAFLAEYRIRSQLERVIHHYASKPLPRILLALLYRQSMELTPQTVIDNARATVHQLLVFNARRLQQFRTLPYLVVLNPSILELYDMYLQTMALLLSARGNLPQLLEANREFARDVVAKFIEVHMDTLPSLSKGFQEVLNLMSVAQIKRFLDSHLVERIKMRLAAHQHALLTAVLDTDAFERGGRYNGVIKPLRIDEVIRKNAELVNDLLAMKYDQQVAVEVDYGFDRGFWNRKRPPAVAPQDVAFPYIEYHLDYILTELLKNSFRAHIENGVSDPVQITLSVSDSPSYLELRIRDKGKGIPKHVVDNIFDYSFSTYESGEGDSYKTLNVPPGLGGNTVAGMGYGLPLLKNYVEVFNETQRQGQTKGLLSIQSYLGWGTDVYLKAVGS